MKKLILLLLFIVGCEEPSQHGCLDGQATNYNADASIDNNTCTYIDSCGVIDIDLTNDCTQDDCGVWGGDGVDADSDSICDDVDDCIGESDNCGTCDSDSTNDCEQDCAGAWGGTSWESDCGCVSATNSGDECGGCMLPDAPNYSSSTTIPCNENGVIHDCCEEIIYGCMDTHAPNYSDTANSPCVAEVSGVDIPNACCLSSLIGCMDQGASNYNSFANVVDNSQCTYAQAVVTDAEGGEITIRYGCMHSSACNFVQTAVADCNQKNVAISGSEWTQNDDCCDMSGDSVCYLDLNNNGYYEQVDSTTFASQSTCDCGEIGVGWVDANQVSDQPELQGCTQVMIDGKVCLEWNPNATIDNGSCCFE